MAFVIFQWFEPTLFVVSYREAHGWEWSYGRSWEQPEFWYEPNTGEVTSVDWSLEVWVPIAWVFRYERRP